METIVFPRFLAHFPAEKVLGRLVASAFFCLQFPTSNFQKLDFRYPAPTSNFGELCVGGRSLNSGSWIWGNRCWKFESNFQKSEVGTRLESTRQKIPKKPLQTTQKPVANRPSRGRGSLRVLTGPHGFPRALLPGGFPSLKLPFFAFLRAFLRGKSIEKAGRLDIL